MAPTRLKALLLGDAYVGKTSLLDAFTGYTRQCYDTRVMRVVYDGEDYELELFGTNGRDEYDNGLRRLAYPGSHVALLMFAVDNRASFERLTTKWIPEMQLHCPHVAYVFVGTKGDLRQPIGNTAASGEGAGAAIGGDVTEAESLALAARFDAPYVETSAVSRMGLSDDTLFHTVISAYNRHRHHRGGRGGGELRTMLDAVFGRRRPTR